MDHCFAVFGLHAVRDIVLYRFLGLPQDIDGH